MRYNLSLTTTCARLTDSLSGWLVVAVVTALLLLSATSGLEAQVHSSARSAAMGGAYTGLAKGADAAKYNPANLGLRGYQRFALEIASVGVNVSNNSFTLDDYNKYTGAILSTSDKQDILNKVPGEGLKIDADVKASAMSLAFGSMAVSVTGFAAADVNLNKDILELILNGNTFADTVQVTGSYSDGLSYGSAELSYGTAIYSAGSRQLSVGLTARYIRGVAVEQLVELEGLAATYETGFQGSGRAIIRTADGGNGYGLDLGAALKFNDTYTAGVRVQNVLGHINWNKGTQEHGYIFEFETATVDDIEDDDYIGSDDYTVDIASFRTTLPTVMNVGFAKASGRLLWAVDWIQGLGDTPGASTKPHLAVGAEYTLLSVLPVRAGYATGGDKNAAFSFGSGLRLMGFYLDAAIFTGTTGSVYSSKGANFAISTGLQF
ncbi:MAG: conjugal transfer protein TraF [bacterium]|nr:conjugal transfer protein TraF [bacterium]